MRSAALTALFLVVALLPAPLAAQESRPEVEQADVSAAELPAHDPNSVIVTVERGRFARPGAASVTEAVGANGVAAAAGDDEPERLTDGVYEIEVDDVDAAVVQLAAEAGVVRVERNWVVTVHNATPLDDPEFSDQWGLDNTGQTVEYGGPGDEETGVAGADIDALGAWTTTAGDSSVVIGIVDSGIDQDHPDLAASLWDNPDAVGGCPAGSRGYDGLSDECVFAGEEPFTGHGTHIAGTVAAIDNTEGVIGVAPGAKLMDLRFISDAVEPTVADAIRTLNFALSARLDAHDPVNLVAVNSSWGGFPFSQALEDVIGRLNDADVLFVTTAGNTGNDVDASPTYPCAYDLPNVVCVAATDSSDNRATFDVGSSGFGANSVHLGAPGKHVVSTERGPGGGPGGYGFRSGTSMAAPHVTGVAALIASSCPLGDASMVATALLQSVDPLASLAHTTVSGGRLNASSAVAEACRPLNTADAWLELAEPGYLAHELPFHAVGLNGQTITANVVNAPPGLTVTLPDPFLVTSDTEAASMTVELEAADGMAHGEHEVVVGLAATTDTASATLHVTIADPDVSVDWTDGPPSLGRGGTPTPTLTVVNHNGAVGAFAATLAAGAPPGVAAAHPPLDVTGVDTEEVPVTLTIDADAALGDGQLDLTLAGTPLPPSKDFTIGLSAGTVMTGTGLALPIGASTGSSTLELPSEPTSGHVTVSLHGLRHTWIGDLTATLTRPSGDSTTLFARPGGPNNGQEFGVGAFRFRDHANETLTSGTPGTYLPLPPSQSNSSLDALGTPAAGDWTLTFTDDFLATDTLSIDGWSLSFDDLAPVTPSDPVATPAVGQGQLDLDWTLSHLEQAATVTVTRVPTVDPPVVVVNEIALTDTASLGTPSPEPEGTHSYIISTESWSDLTADVTLSGVVVDRTPPPAPTLAAAPGQSPVDVAGTDWFDGPVTIEVTAGADPDLPDTSPGSGLDPATSVDFVVDGDGLVLASRTVSDLAGNESPAGTLDVHIDKADPVVDLTGCPTGDVTRNSSQEVVVTAADDHSGLADDPSGTHALDTSADGPQSFSVTAVDNVGHSATATCDYTVVAPAVTPPPPPPAPVPTETEPEPTETEPPTGPTSVEGDQPKPFAVGVSGQRFGDAGGFAQDETLPVATHAVLARVDVFADALAAAPLSGTGPLLFTDSDQLDPAVADELTRVLSPGGTVYLLGGESALTATVEQAVADLGLVPARLAGPSRVETALEVADTLTDADPPEQVLLARAYGLEDNPTAAWADALTGGAYGAATGTPILLTPTETLHPAVVTWLADHADPSVVVLGGEAAVSPDAVASIVGAERVAGPDRAATATEIAARLWGPLATGGFAVTNGYRDDGWTYGLAGAGLAADRGAPLLLTNDTVPPATRTAVADCDQPGPPDLLFLSSHVSTDVRDDLTTAWQADCAP